MLRREQTGDGGPENATKPRRNVPAWSHTRANAAMSQPGEPIRSGERGTVAAMSTSRVPTAVTVAVSAHAAEQYRHRVKPGLDVDAARGELEWLRAIGEISAQEPAWLRAANPAPYYLLIRDAIVLPLLPQAGRWVATTCVCQRTPTPTRRGAKTARRASLPARKRAQRRARG